MDSFGRATRDVRDATARRSDWPERMSEGRRPSARLAQLAAAESAASQPPRSMQGAGSADPFAENTADIVQLLERAMTAGSRLAAAEKTVAMLLERAVSEAVTTESRRAAAENTADRLLKRGDLLHMRALAAESRLATAENTVDMLLKRAVTAELRRPAADNTADLLLERAVTAESLVIAVKAKNAMHLARAHQLGIDIEAVTADRASLQAQSLAEADDARKCMLACYTGMAAAEAAAVALRGELAASRVSLSAESADHRATLAEMATMRLEMATERVESEADAKDRLLRWYGRG